MHTKPSSQIEQEELSVNQDKSCHTHKKEFYEFKKSPIKISTGLQLTSAYAINQRKNLLLVNGANNASDFNTYLSQIYTTEGYFVTSFRSTNNYRMYVRAIFSEDFIIYLGIHMNKSNQYGFYNYLLDNNNHLIRHNDYTCKRLVCKGTESSHENSFLDYDMCGNIYSNGETGNCISVHDSDLNFIRNIILSRLLNGCIDSIAIKGSDLFVLQRFVGLNNEYSHGIRKLSLSKDKLFIQTFFIGNRNFSNPKALSLDDQNNIVIYKSSRNNCFTFLTTCTEYSFNKGVIRYFKMPKCNDPDDSNNYFDHLEFRTTHVYQLYRLKSGFILIYNVT